MNVKIAPSWKSLLKDEFEKPYFISLAKDLKQLKTQGKTIYPPGPLIFNAFDHTPVDKVKVVIIGQDPYHGPGEAMGLSFSVPKGVRIPPSLKNIFKEMKDDIGGNLPIHGDLTSWADQGVFLLNAILTVEHKKAGSHKNLGWHLFTDAVIEKLSLQREGLVFMLWGNFARSKKVLIAPEKGHLILEAPHPSPLARGGFFGCKHFSKANAFLDSPIDWNIS
jgi:uracil-DNA glycosylase